jgi:2',3'-cyclic-nucleotide 2'-phosphodiesterase (5'-nucleotidase family)
VRVVTTNDFVGSFFPQATSYGRLPGAAALQATVDDLRTEGGGALWIDTGDLAQGSALGALSDGVWPFLALRELSIDVAVAGNHELDWGVAHLRRWGGELRFALLAANLDIGLPATRMLHLGDRAVGVIGLSAPSMPVLHPDMRVDADSAALVARHAAALRREGVEHVVLALHDGVDPGTARMEALCGAVRGSVDLVLGGHTLRCFAGSLAGVPFLQPWAFGSQVGVADLHDDGRVELRLVDAGPPRAWTGPGAAAQAALEAEVVGHLDAPLRQADGRETSLAQAVAEGLLRHAGDVDWAYVAPGDLWNQPARDGVHAHVGAGDVTLAQVLRLAPLTGGRSAWGGQLLAAELAAGEAERVVAALIRVHPGLVARRPRRGAAVTLALSPYVAAAAGDHGWAPIAATWRDGLLAAVSA